MTTENDITAGKICTLDSQSANPGKNDVTPIAEAVMTAANKSDSNMRVIFKKRPDMRFALRFRTAKLLFF